MAQRKVDRLANKSMLAERYQIKDTLGYNGISVTYQAYDTFRERMVAIKELFPEKIVHRNRTDKIKVDLIQLADEALLEEMKEHVSMEAKALMKLFPLEGIANVILFFEENGTVYVVTEYIEGATLEHFLFADTSENLPLDSILNFFEPIVDSLKKIHEAGFYHGKIRPNQIMVTKKNGAKLIGFCDPMGDIIKEPFLEAEVSARSSIYSPVEQFMEDGEQGKHTDVYGLSAMIYHCVTGEAPAHFYDRVAKADAMLSPWEKQISITEEQSNAIMKGMAPHVFDRFQNLEEYIGALQTEAESDEIKETPPPLIFYRPPNTFLRKERIRRRIKAGVIIVAACFLIWLIPKTVTFGRQKEVSRFYKKFMSASLYEQCEMLKWMGPQKREEIANDYSQIENLEDLNLQYYDIVNKKMVEREDMQIGSYKYSYLEIAFRENNLVYVVLYKNNDLYQLEIDLNNLGDAYYQVNERMEENGVSIKNENYQVSAESDRIAFTDS